MRRKLTQSLIRASLLLILPPAYERAPGSPHIFPSSLGWLPAMRHLTGMLLANSVLAEQVRIGKSLRSSLLFSVLSLPLFSSILTWLLSASAMGVVRPANSPVLCAVRVCSGKPVRS